MQRTRWHTHIWPTPRVARGKARNDKANREQLALKSGGDDEDRTHDLRIANATLSQLSYVPGKQLEFYRDLRRDLRHKDNSRRTIYVPECRDLPCR